jgi:hypothetical protein
MPATDSRSGWFGELAGTVDRFVRVRIDRLAATARQQTDQLTAHAGERFARSLVDQLSRRLAARLPWAVAAVAALVMAISLLAIGLAGALGEFYGRAWIGQLVAGSLMLLVALATGAIARARTRLRDEREALEAAPAAEGHGPQGDVEAGAGMPDRHPIVEVAAISAFGLLTHALLARTNGRERRDH